MALWSQLFGILLNFQAILKTVSWALASGARAGENPFTPLTATRNHESPEKNKKETAMKRSWLVTVFLVLGMALVGLAAEQQKPAKEAPVVPPRQGKSETIQLFNGTDLTGREGHDDLWSVKDGVIIGKNTKEQKVSTYLLTKRKVT